MKNKNIEYKYCKSIYSKFRGLMFRRPIKNRALVFIFDKMKNPMEIAIHNIFVFFSIDVYYLNSNLEVVDYVKNFKPFSLFFKPKYKAKYVVEFVSGVANYKKGDKIYIL